jgi:hypothetical protein
MVRLKFLLFALLALGLGLVHLPMVSGPLSAHAVEGASAQAASAISDVTRALDARRGAVQGLTLKLAASRELAQVLQPLLVPVPPLPAPGRRPLRAPRGQPVERPLQQLTEERFASARAVVEAALPEELRPVAAFALVTDKQAWHARVGSDASQDEQELPARELAATGSQGVVADAFGSPHFFVSVPVLWLHEPPLKGVQPPPRLMATLVLGAPLVSENVIAHAASNSGVAALALLKGSSVVGTAGTEKALVELARTQLQPGGADVIQRGEVQVLLDRLKLPLLVGVDDVTGGKAPLAVGMRRNLRNTPYEVVSVATVRPFMRALAEYQQNALLGLAGLAGFSVVWALVMGLGLGERSRKAEGKVKRKGTKSELAAVQGDSPAPGTPYEESTAPVPSLAAEMPTVETPLAAITGRNMPEVFPPSARAELPQTAPDSELPAAMPPEPSPLFGRQAEEPFSSPPPGSDPFGNLSQAQELPYAPTAASSLPFDLPPSSPEPSAVSTTRRSAFDVQDQPTAAFTLQQASDPFAVAAAQAGAGDFSEATRVTQIPQELLQATQQPPPVTASPSQRTTAPTLSGIFPMPTGAFSAPTAAAPPLGSQPTQSGSFNMAEEQHFQEIFREFLTTRDRCGEPNDGLTYEKFAAKLRKNKEQLMQKYACRTVRFQVYVKEGKAALKATPVKE